MGNVSWCCSELFCWKNATNKRDHREIPWRWPNCHQSKTCCPIARTWVGIDRNMPLLQIAIKLNWRHRGYELQHNASVPGSTCTSVSRGSLFNFRILIELLGKDFLDIINRTRGNITPAMFSQLQQCRATSCVVERSFSLLKKLLSKERNFLPDNLKKYFIFYYNHAAKEIQWFVPYIPFQIKSYIKSYFDKR